MMNRHEENNARNPQTLLSRFAEQVRHDPQALAVIDRQVRLTYAQLASASERIAKGLLAQGASPAEPIALCMPRCWQWVATILAVLKVGAVVVPLDRASPARRRQLMLDDAGCVGLVTLGEDADSLAAPQHGWYVSVEALLEFPDQPALRLPEDFAVSSFLFYTSGTTGTPKAVDVGEPGLLRLARTDGCLDIRAGERVACLSNPAFDACNFELWAPLLNGGCCVIIADADLQDAQQLARVLETQQVDSLFMTVSLFNTLSADNPACFASLRQVLIGGEQVSAAAVRAWYQANPDSRCRIFNAYGPTECTTFAVCYPIPRDFAGDAVPIGRPLPDTGVQVLDPQQRAVASGEAGELYLSGSGVARGYRNRAAETEQRFLRLPTIDAGDVLHYRTGDQVRVNADGLIEYLGRIDRQVKVRGFRIEPGEVEQRILEHPQVAQVHVCTRRQAAEDHQLLAFIVPREALDYRDFDQHLRDNLAVWMRPHQLFVLQRLPLTSNGKIDQRALLEQPLKPWRPQAGSRADEQLSPALDWLLSQARRLLAQPELNGDDDWLGSGGDSLKAMRLRSAIRTHWRREITLGAVLSESFSALAERLGDEQGEASAYPPAPPVNRSGRAPATAEQSRLWLMQQRTPQATAYNVPLILHLAAGVQLSALVDAVQRLLTRHSGLRTAFVSAADGLHQQVHQREAVCQTFATGA
ncbi:amino acid adenylation domain-containing protein, partial [Pseudomonas syringae]|nr:amino acid adenylation domain-containing protein [Pseudomonas syringae]